MGVIIVDVSHCCHDTVSVPLFRYGKLIRGKSRFAKK